MRGALVVAACAAPWLACLEAPPGAAVPDAAPDVADAGDPCPVPLIAAATLTSCALADGKVRCFGFDANGELGNDEELTGSGEPVLVAGIDDATFLAGGSYAFCAIRADGGARCWGKNETGQLGDQTTELRAMPVDVLDVTGIVDIEIGGGHACAVVEGREVRCWGRNDHAQLGNGAPTETSLVPVLAAVGPALDVEASYAATCVILDDDAGVACWGLATGGFDSPAAIIYPMSGVVDLAMHSHAIYAVLDDGTVMAWGNNAYGQLGDDSVESRADPAPVRDLPPAIAVSAGADHACALAEGGDVWCWGRNRYGQIGKVNADDAHLPVRVEEIPPAVRLVSGQEHTCATAEDGEITCWGNNCCGQLGPRAKDPTSPPGQVDHLCVMPL